MNPPLRRKIINASVEVFIANWKNNTILEAIALVNNATETKWFQLLLKSSSVICLPEKRISFDALTEKMCQEIHGESVFILWSGNK
jgi:hypothetical protein